MKPVITWELKRRRFFIMWWVIGITSLVVVNILAYKAVSKDAAQLNSALGSLSSSAGSFFGGSDFFSPIGYLSSQVYYLMLPLLVIIMASSLSSGLMNRDENDNTIEYTLARPISRLQLLYAKAIVWLTVMGLVGAITYVITLVSVRFAGIHIGQANILKTHLLAFAFSGSFGLIAFALMAASRLTRKFATSLAMVLAFGGYIVASLASLLHWLQFPAKFMPYYYYDTVAMLGGHVQRGLLIYLAGTVVIVAVVASVGYSRRDIG